MGFFISILVGLIISAATLVLSELLRPKLKIENAKPAGAGDFNFPTAVEGRPVPLIWGKVKIAGPNVIWWGDLKQVPIKESIKTGLWSKKRIIKGYQYFVGIQMAICKAASSAAAGPTLHNIFVGDKPFRGAMTHDTTIFEDQPLFLGGLDFGNGGIQANLTYHDGRSTQTTNAYLATQQSPITPHRGTAYLAFEGGYIGNLTSIQPWSFEVSRYPAGLVDQGVLTSGHEIVSTDDANPMEVLYEILIDDDWGFGFLNADVDLASLGAVAETLWTEGNGFSMQLERVVDASEIVNLIQEQVDGVLFLDKATGKWKFKLARDDYTLATLPALNNDNIIEVKDFARQTWDGTSNQVRIGFTDRSRDYFDTFAQSHDLANQKMQQGEIVATTIEMPGVKNRTLATQLSARELRFLSYPLAKATLVVDRTFWQTNPADVLRWTDDDLGFVDLPVRVSRIDFGDFVNGKITLGLTQDIFTLETGFFGEPQDTLWTLPTQDVAAIPIAEHQVFEAPKAIIDRDPDITTQGREDRVFVGARAQAGAIAIDIFTRHNTANPVDPQEYFLDGIVEGMFLIGSLNVGVNSEDANPTGTIQLSATLDSIVRMVIALPIDGASPIEIGQGLANVIKIDEEFIGFRDSTNTPTTIDLTTCYRGLMDSVPADHSAGASVYLLFVNSGLSDGQIPPDNFVDVQPRTRSRDDSLSAGDAKTFEFQMSNRYRRPYPPSRMDINSVRMDPAVSVNTGVDVDWFRRDYLTEDEVASLEVDDTGVHASHENRVRILADDGVTELVLGPWETGTGPRAFERDDILKKVNGVLPTAAQVKVAARHDVGALTDLEALQELTQVTAMSDTELSGLQNLGTIGANVATGGYTVVDDAVDHNFRLEDGTLAGGAVEYQLNSITGGWTSLITAGGTTGIIAAAALSASDVIFFRHLDTSDNGDNVTFFGDENGTDVLYGILTDDAEWDNLQGYWSMDESSTGVSAVARAARFGSGTPDFTDVNTCESIAGDVNFVNAVRLRQIAGPTQEHLSIPNAQAEPRIIPTGDFTVTAWVYLEDTTLDGTTRTIVGCIDVANGGPSFTDRVFHLSINGADDRLTAQVHGSAGAPGTSAAGHAALTEETWIHVALVKSGTAYDVYTDGTVGATQGGAITSALNATTTDLMLGTYENAGSPDTTNASLDMRLDELRVYHRALSSGEISEIASRTRPV